MYLLALSWLLVWRLRPSFQHQRDILGERHAVVGIFELCRLQSNSLRKRATICASRHSYIEQRANTVAAIVSSAIAMLVGLLTLY